MGRKAGILRVTTELLEQALLPGGHRITHVVPQTAEDMTYGVVQFVVEGEQCERVVEGEALPWIVFEMAGQNGAGNAA